MEGDQGLRGRIDLRGGSTAAFEGVIDIGPVEEPVIRRDIDFFVPHAEPAKGQGLHGREKGFGEEGVFFEGFFDVQGRGLEGVVDLRETGENFRRLAGLVRRGFHPKSSGGLNERNRKKRSEKQRDEEDFDATGNARGADLALGGFFAAHVDFRRHRIRK